MFRIVEETEPPIPETASPLLDDFRRQCLQKDPASRPNAETLCEHEWLKENWGYSKVYNPQRTREGIYSLKFDSGTAGQHPLPPPCRCGVPQKGYQIPPRFG